MLHPPVVHFAIVLPIIALIIGIRYLSKPSSEMSKVSSGYFLFAALFMIAAFFTGKHDGAEAYPLLNSDGVEDLMEHKALGMYLAIGMAITALLKIFGTIRENKKLEIVSVILLAMITATTLYQGKLGGELTFEHGANVLNHSDGMDCLDDPEEFLKDE